MKKQIRKTVRALVGWFEVNLVLAVLYMVGSTLQVMFNNMFNFGVSEFNFWCLMI